MKQNEIQRWLQGYYAEISSLLPCDRRERNALLRELRASVEEYLTDQPCATPEALLSVFGTPA